MISSFRKAVRDGMLDQIGATGQPFSNTYAFVRPYFNDVTPAYGMDSTTFQVDDGTILNSGGSSSVGAGSNFVNGLNEAGEYTKASPDAYIDSVKVGAPLPVTIYGYTMNHDSIDTTPDWAVRFDHPIELTSEGQLINFAVYISIAQEPMGVGNLS